MMTLLEAKLLTALKTVMEDYRSEGCPNPKCILCEKSNAAKKMAEEAIAHGEAVWNQKRRAK
jgi:hypothetical protein